MDRAIYTAMTGARLALDRQNVVSQNLSQLATPGFRAQLSAASTVDVAGGQMDTRSGVLGSDTSFDTRTGAIRQTGNSLDVALVGDGWLSVTDPDGNEAYTRFGALSVSVDGILQTNSGRPVLGDGGPLQIPPETQIDITAEGRVISTAVVAGQTVVNEVGRLKLVNPPVDQLARGEDGLFRLTDGGVADASEQVRLVPKAIESSNVNAVQAMVDMIGLGRQFEMQMQMMKKLEENDARSSQLLNLS